ncbi:MAG: response regulator [Rhizobiaceae bacterium]
MDIRKPRSRGSGINSIPVRFSLVATIFTACACAAVQILRGFEIDMWFYAANSAAAAISGISFFLMGKELIQPIRELEQITSAIAAGELPPDASIDCECDVGLLGDSVKTMIARLADREASLRKSREEARVQSNQMVDALNALSDQFALFDQADRLLLANQAFERAMERLGVSIAPGATFDEMIEFISQSPKIATNENARLRWIERQKDIRARARQSTTPLLIERSDGVATRISVYDSPSGNTVDLRVDATEEMARQRALEKALREAEAGDRTKAEFLANMSHEIRTPMNGVIGMAELLAMTELDDRQRMFTDVIVRSGTVLMNVINDILDYSKLSAGQVVLDLQPFKISGILDEAVQLLAARTIEKDIEMIVRIDPAMPECLIGDKGRVRQILLNIAGNAVKFTEFGHVSIDISPGADGTGLRLTIEDTGCGIPANRQEHIFEHFCQADSTSTRNHDGNGLGLTISRALARLMGGEITVESALGSGSTFIFEAPLVHAGASRVKRLPKTFVEGRKPRALIIDDNPVNRDLYVEMLSVWGFDVAAADRGATGIQILLNACEQAIPADLIILDFAMPDMNGLEVAQKIRENPALARMPILLLTSMDFDPGSSFIEAGYIDAWLTKPAREQELFDCIGAMIATPGSLPEGSDGARGEILKINFNGIAGKTEMNAGSAIDVLVAEDNGVNQILITRILEQSGLSYEVVSDGEMAVELCRTRSPRIVLMDISMPRLNGIDATRLIREQENGTRRVPIIAVTAHALEEDIERCMACGMDDFIAKPISPQKLLARIGEWLGRESVAKQA